MDLRRIFAVAACVAAVMSVGAGSAFAGEVTGNGKPLWTNSEEDWAALDHELHGNSICAFSGQEDGQFPASPEYSPDAGHAQSWGQIPKAFRDILADDGFHPGDSCNGHTG